MTSELWHEVANLFDAASDLGAPARAALLAERCEGRPDLRAEVESLLLADARAPGFLEMPAAVVTPPPPIDVVERVGPYRLVERIGAGGMAAVFRARRDDDRAPREVAVKIAACADRGLDRERQWLRALRHPHVVTLVDVDSELDAPFLVMELVDGPPITQYCEQHALPIDRRLRLFRDVCAAVHHVHERGIVHRDLKPANVLVTRAGVVKLIDFGVATRVDATGGPSRRAPARARRDEVPVPLTPNYASPEQICGHRVTTASDVYALGVLLYELVTGARPYEADGLPLAQLRTVVLRTMPKKPTTTTRFAGGRRHGDLDAVVLKALDKRPERRYASAGALSAGVGRCLDRLTTSAR